MNNVHPCKGFFVIEIGLEARRRWPSIQAFLVSGRMIRAVNRVRQILWKFLDVCIEAHCWHIPPPPLPLPFWPAFGCGIPKVSILGHREKPLRQSCAPELDVYKMPLGHQPGTGAAQCQETLHRFSHHPLLVSHCTCHPRQSRLFFPWTSTVISCRRDGARQPCGLHVLGVFLGSSTPAHGPLSLWELQH